MIRPNKMKMVVSAIIVSLGLATLFVGHGCGKVGESATSMGSSSNSINGVVFDPPTDIDPLADTRTVSTVYAKNVLDNFVSCTGIGVESATTKGIWDSRKGSLSDFGYATNISAPMMMAITSVAGEVCNDLITQEKAMAANSRNIFNSFDLSANPSRMPASVDIGDAASRLAISCWQRNIAADEKQMIEDDVSSMASGVPTSAKEVYNAAIATCTAMLSSLSAIEM